MKRSNLFYVRWPVITHLSFIWSPPSFGFYWHNALPNIFCLVPFFYFYFIFRLIPPSTPLRFLQGLFLDFNSDQLRFKSCVLRCAWECPEKNIYDQHSGQHILMFSDSPKNICQSKINSTCLRVKLKFYL